MKHAGLAAAFATALAACAAPVVRDLTSARLPGPERAYPPGTESVRIARPDGDELAGVYLAADPGAPLVLALLEDRSSVLEQPRGYAELAGRLGDLGFAFFACDWSGIGASPGSSSAKKLGPDARALCAEAVRRAGGDPARVVVRGVRLGTLGVAELLVAREPLGGAILTAPVRPRSFAHRQAREIFGPLPGGIAWLCFRAIPTADPVEALAASEIPALALLIEGEGSLDEDDQAAFRSAAKPPRVEVRELPLMPAALHLGQRGALPEEVAWLVQRFPQRVDAAWRIERARAALSDAGRARLAADAAVEERFRALAPLALHTSADWIAASAANGLGAIWLEALVRARAQPGAWRDLGFDDLAATFDLSDPAGDLPPKLLAAWMRTFPAADPGAIGALSAIEDAAAAHGRPVPDDAGTSDEASAGDPNRLVELWLPAEARSASFRRNFVPLWDALSAGIPAQAAERRFVRSLLKTWGFCAEKLEVHPGEDPRVLVLVGGEWTEFAQAAERDRRALAAAR